MEGREQVVQPQAVIEAFCESSQPGGHTFGRQGARLQEIIEDQTKACKCMDMDEVWTMYSRSRSHQKSVSDFEDHILTLRPGGMWQLTAPHFLARVFLFRGKLKLALWSLINVLWWFSQSKLQCRHSCLWLSMNFCLIDHKNLLVGSAQSHLRQELTRYSGASNPLLVFVIITKAITGRHKEKEDLACR